MICSQAKSGNQPESEGVTDNLNFTDKLQDVVGKIKITPNFTIVHADYEPLEIPDQYRDYLQQMPASQRDRYLIVKLQQYLYAIFNGDLKPKHNSALEINDNSQTDDAIRREEIANEEIANYEDKWYKTKFYHQLTKCNHGQGYSDPNWLLVERITENQWKISKNGLYLYIDPQKHLVAPSLKLQIGQTVSIKMPSNLVDRGVYIAVGNAGSTINNTESSSESTIVQLYFNVNSEGALLLLDCLTRELNTLKITFDFKIAYDVASLADLDAAVLEFKSVDFAQLLPIIKDVYRHNQTYFQPEIPFFCKYLASGLGLAEKPHQVSELEFKNIGQYYCGIIAETLLEIWQQNHEFDECDRHKFNCVLNCLSSKSANIKYLYLNPNSIDIYGAAFRSTLLEDK